LPRPSISDVALAFHCATSCVRHAMKHLNPTKSVMRHVLQRARTIAIVGVSPSPDRHSHAVAQYLAHEGYDVIAVRPDRADVVGLATYASLADIPGAVDCVVLLGQAIDDGSRTESRPLNGVARRWTVVLVPSAAANVDPSKAVAASAHDPTSDANRGCHVAGALFFPLRS
jgi:hypothetical protein